jgi:hypothetical protein
MTNSKSTSECPTPNTQFPTDEVTATTIWYAELKSLVIGH